MSNAPTVLFGEVPMVRTVVRSSTSATATTVTPDDSGTLFVNLSTSAHTYTLPTVSDCAGKSFWFFNGDTTAGITVTGGTVDKIMGIDDSAADSVTDTGTDAYVGDWVLILGDGTYFYAFIGAGTWSAST